MIVVDNDNVAMVISYHSVDNDIAAIAMLKGQLKWKNFYK